MRAFLVIITLVVSAGVIAAWAEPEFDLTTGLWWSIVTLTTVGYGDFSPQTLIGRIVAVFLMVLGIGVLGGGHRIYRQHVHRTAVTGGERVG